MTDSIPTTLRLLHIIEELATAGQPLTPTALNQNLGLPKPSIHRLIKTLQDNGFIESDVTGRAYRPAARLKQMASGILSSQDLRMARHEILAQLSRDIGETCNIAVPHRRGMTYLERVETQWPLRIQLPVGSQVPHYCTASGKLYLSTLSYPHLAAYLDAVPLMAQTAQTVTDAETLRRALRDIRKQGYATDYQEFMQEMLALAVPIYDGHDRLVATLSVHAPLQRCDDAQLLTYLPKLQRAAAQLTALLN